MKIQHIVRVGRRLLSAAVTLAAGWLLLRSQLPDSFTLAPGEDLELANMPYLAPMADFGAHTVQQSGAESETLALFGLIPIKTVHTTFAETTTVTVCGTPFGIKMFADGAMVVGFTDIYTDQGWRNPGKEAGLRMGDILLSMGNIHTTGNSQVQQAVEQAQGEGITITYSRDGQQQTTTITPVRDAGSGDWRIGVWVRDSSAGIGTLTFVEKNTGVYGGLGHSISDADTGESISLLSGEVVPVEITGYKVGQPGQPGELRGMFAGNTMGDILLNGATGVYGHIRSFPQGMEMLVANKQQVEKGKAVILTTIDGSGPHAYEVEIEQAKLAGSEPNRDLLVHITDPQLLQSTGGIVQGMSGSPIIQNGRLVGAVTHVLVNDPTRGYGIFAENMLATARSVEEKWQKQAA